MEAKPLGGAGSKAQRSCYQPALVQGSLGQRSVLPAHTGDQRNYFPAGRHAGSQVLLGTGREALCLAACIHTPASRQREGNRPQDFPHPGSVSDKTLPPGNPHSSALEDPHPGQGGGWIWKGLQLSHAYEAEFTLAEAPAHGAVLGRAAPGGRGQVSPSLMCDFSGH